jgi:3-oxoacyl-[acyl-carrier protein] reductase
LGALDVLINNAGIARMNAFALTPVSNVQEIMNTNFLGTFIFCQKAINLLRKSPNARIINLSTVAVPLNLAGEAAYAASKAAVETLTRIMAKEIGSFGITCNAIGLSPRNSLAELG